VIAPPADTRERATLPFMKSRLLSVAAALSLLAAPARAEGTGAPAEQYTLRVEYLWWSPQPAGQIQKGIGDLPGTVLDAEADLGLNAASANAVRGALRLGGAWKLRGSWSPLDFRGDVAAPRPFVYGTTVVQAGDQVITTLKGNYVTGELEWDFVERDGGFLGLLFGAKYFDVDAILLNAETSSRVAETERLPIPVLGLAGRAYLHPRFSLEAEISGLTAGDRGHVWELLLAARIHLSDHLAGTSGYHKLALEGRNDRDYFNLDLGTWTFGVELSL
jgi:hypothetical protein